jgi:heme exporter protein B
MTAAVFALMRKDLSLEWRNKSAFTGVLLYLVSTVFICYLSFDGLVPVHTWNALFWVILLFASLNAVLKGFLQEGERRIPYYYTLASPAAVMMARIVYNAFLMGLLALSGWGMYTAVMGNPVQNQGLFLLNLILGAGALSAALSMVSAIASRARNPFTLMGVLGFPVVLPLLLVVIRISASSIQGASLAAQWGNLLVLLLLAGISVVLANLLFPYIWRE